MNEIETARTLLAKESPELRRAVGELILKVSENAFTMGTSKQAVQKRILFRLLADEQAKFDSFARELIEDKT